MPGSSSVDLIAVVRFEIRSRHRKCRRRRDGRAFELCGQPAQDDCDDVLLLPVVESTPGTDPMPLGQTTPTAGRRRVLGDKNRMAAQRSLSSVIARRSGRESLADKPARVLGDREASSHPQIFQFLRRQREPAPETRRLQRSEKIIDISHRQKSVRFLAFGVDRAALANC